MSTEPGIKLLTTSEVARRLHRSSDRVRQLARSGRLIAALTIGSGQRLFDESEVERYEEQRHSEAAG